MKKLAIFFLAGFLSIGPGWAEAEWEKRLAVAAGNAVEISTFVKTAREKHGEFGEKAAVFLVEGMSAADLRKLSTYAAFEDSTLGEEFTVGGNEMLVSGLIEDNQVAVLWGGVACNFR